MNSIDKLFFIIVSLTFLTQEKLLCQEMTEATEELIENNAMASDGIGQDINESEDGNYEVKYDINHINETQLLSFNILNFQQINNFILYRKNMGGFISLFELQAVPGWDIETIKLIIHRFKIRNIESRRPIQKLLKEGNHSILYRIGKKSLDTLINGIVKPKDLFSNKSKQLVRYSFEIPEKMNAGLTIEKDPGEKSITDYASGYLAFSSTKILKNVTVGDYTVNMGQGLIEWRGYSTGMTSQITSGYRQGPLIWPHRGTDENKFHRGVALSFNKAGITMSVFASNQYIDANIISDRVTNKKTISSFLVSGIHATDSEKADRKTAEKSTIGGSLKIKISKTNIGLNHISTFFNAPVQKKDEPHNYFAMQGNQYINSSIDFSSNVASGFLFGEAAIDERLNSGFILGMLKSIDPRLDIAFIYRNISKGYRSFQPNAFTQNTDANNEQGKFININFRINPRTKIESYVDHYTNNWPQYYNDGVRRGNLISIQYSWDPNKKTAFYIKLQSKQKNSNIKLVDNKTNLLGEEHISNCRIHISFTPFNSITVRHRTELSLFSGEYKKTEKGFLSYLELIYKPTLKPYSISARISAVETDGYNSRIYAYERDLLYYYSIPSLFNNGFRNYILFNYKVSKHLQIWLKWIQAKSNITSNFTSQVQSNQKTTKEWRVQLIWKS